MISYFFLPLIIGSGTAHPGNCLLTATGSASTPDKQCWKLPTIQTEILLAHRP
jgi:hypothetical protein